MFQYGDGAGGRRIGRIFKLGFQPVNVLAQYYGNAVHPVNGSWDMRLQLAFLFPKLSAKEKELLMEEKLKEMEKESQK